MLLLLDIGNTSIKYRLYHGNISVEAGKLTQEQLVEKARNHKNFISVTQLFYSDVRGGFSTLLCQIFPKALQLSLSDNALQYPFINAYRTTKTLGSDRRALVSAAYFVYPQAHCLVIDAGSCITYDFIDRKGIYHGGAISPGIAMRYKVLHQQTGKLPLLPPSTPATFIGQSTEAALHGGVYYGVLGEILHQVSLYEQNYPDLQVVLTGGDGHWLFKNIKKPIFAEPNFLLDGMFALWQYNKNS